MNFFLARTFTRALEKLDNQDASLAKLAALEFQLNPSQPGFKFHRIQNARDKNMWSFRINRDLRAIVHHQDDAFILCYVDHHDDAYTWAERHKIERHPTTGQTQIVEVVERTEVITRTHYDDQTVVLPPLAKATDALLLSIGVPPQWVDWVQTSSEATLLDHIERLPEAVQHNLLELLTGGLVTPPVPVPQEITIAPSREIVPIEDADDLERALNAPWEQWLIFLHPEQRAVVDQSLSGAARIYGSAGTGKTIVALHRVKWLLEHHPEQPILLTTYTNALTANLAERLRLLTGDDPEDVPHLQVTNFHRWLTHWHRARFGHMDLITHVGLTHLIAKGCAAYPDVGFSPDYILSEYKAIIDPHFIRTKEEYFAASRAGRGQALGKRLKLKLWQVIEHVHQELLALGQSTLNQYSGRCVEHFAAHPQERPFAHVVVDEAQDFSPIELQALRAIVPEGPDDLFLCSDAGQRLYGRAFSWLKNGIDIRGRSTQLKVNYRTTEHIRAACEALLPPSLEGPNEQDESRQARSLRPGHDITLVPCQTDQEQIVALTTWVKDLVEVRRILPAQIAILARKSGMAIQITGKVARALGLDYTPIHQTHTAQGLASGEMKMAKGLEYRAVAIVGCDAHTVPHKDELANAASDEGDLFDTMEMERNLLYVAGTRARDELFISYVGAPSPFLSLLITPQPAPHKPDLPHTPAPAPTQAERSADPPLPVPHPAPGQVAQFKISPARVAQYFGLNCPRYLRYSSAWNHAQLVADGTPSAAATRPYLDAIFASGYAWEHDVLTHKLDPKDLLLAPGDGPLTERFFSPAQTIEVLTSAPVGSFIYEMTLVAPASLYKRLGIDQELLTFSPCRPDLVQVLAAPEGSPHTRLLRIIDMKRSAAVHATHHIQLAFYALLLDAVITDAPITDLKVDMDHGAIWLGDHDKPTPCAIDAVRPHLHEFLHTQAHALFTTPMHQVFWHVHPKCEWCPYLDHCSAEMLATDDLSKLPRLTHQGKQHLLDHGIHTIAQLDTLLEDPEARTTTLATSATLTAQLPLMSARVRALAKNTVLTQGYISSGLTLPTPTEVTVFLTLQRETLGRHTYALGYQVHWAEDVPERVVRRHAGKNGECFVARNAGEVGTIQRQFVIELYGLLSRVDAYNLGQPWAKKLSVQCIVASRAEENLLTEVLFDAMDTPDLAEAARTLLMYFQAPDLILANQHPDQHVALPVTVLLNVVGRTVALPIPVAYTMPEILAALEVEVDYPRDPLFHHPFSALMRADAIFEAWYANAPERLPQIHAHLEHTLRALSALFDTLRTIAKSDLHTFMPKFELPLAASIKDPLLSKLAFFAQYEAASRCKQVRQERMTARQAIDSHPTIHPLVAVDEHHFTLTGPAPARLEPSTFTTWLLARDTPQGRRAQIQYNDFHHRNSFWGGGRRDPDLAVVQVTETTKTQDDVLTAIACKYTRPLEDPTPRKDERFLLYERFSNSLMDRNIQVLESLDIRPHDLLGQLLGRPDTITPLPIPCPADPTHLGLTPSQVTALEHLQTHRVLALWGPPGTGKTHFLATAILALIQSHKACQKPFRVLIHTFTHAASENVLAKITALMPQLGIQDDALTLGKVAGWKGDKAPEHIKEVKDKRTIPAWLKKHDHAVLAGTAWAYDKLLCDANTAFEGVDLVVMDEASQIKVPEAAIGINLVHEQGRVLLAGDHLQLPPIVVGTYPEPPEGQIALNRSIFEAVCGLSEGKFMRQLEENFRMNHPLTTLSASLLYGPRYRCGTQLLADARLNWSPEASDSEFVRCILDPAYPVTVVLLHGLAPAKDNAFEAQIVAELTLALRQGLCDQQAERFLEDSEFFERGVFIVSPHHSQIQRIRSCLNELRAWEAEPFVDTVDKMQGQEAMAVLVSYGVSDPEFAMREAEFIYSRNRLNVSVTRARHKTILLLPAALLHAPPRILEREVAAQGLGYMRELVEWVRRGSEEVMFLREDRQVEILRR